MKKIILIPAIAGLLFVAGANANVLSNSSFETPILGAGDFEDINLENITNWSAAGGGLVGNAIDGVTANSGDNFIKLFGGELQSDLFSVFAGTEYTGTIQVNRTSASLLTGGSSAIAFAWYKDAAGTDVSDEKDFSFNVVSATALTADVWQTQTIIDFAPSDAVSARFLFKTESLTNDGGDSVLYYDNASVVPEPSTYAMIAGFLAFGFVAVRRRMATK